LEEIKRNITAVNQKSKKVSKIQAIIKTIKSRKKQSFATRVSGKTSLIFRGIFSGILLISPSCPPHFPLTFL